MRNARFRCYKAWAEYVLINPFGSGAFCFVCAALLFFLASTNRVLSSVGTMVKDVNLKGETDRSLGVKLELSSWQEVILKAGKQ